MPVPRPIIDRSGLTLPTFDDFLSYVRNGYRDIYGRDIVLTNDSQDGQLTAEQAEAMFDTSSVIAAVYNSFSPATAVGTGLSSNVKINGIRRMAPTYSTVDLRMIGVNGTTVTGGRVLDVVTTQIWLVPDFTIGESGEITVTARAQELGAITASPHSITRIQTPERGWQSVDNIDYAVPGDPVETDAMLRQRQALSTANPSRATIESIVGGIADLSGVTEIKAYENDTGLTDEIGLPAHSVSFVVKGGDAGAVANEIFTRKAPSMITYGTTAVDLLDAQGIKRTIRFFRPWSVYITYAIDLRKLPGWQNDTEARIKQELVDWTNSNPIGRDVMPGRAYVPINLGGAAISDTYDVLSVKVARDGQAPQPVDVPIRFTEEPLTRADLIVVRYV